MFRKHPLRRPIVIPRPAAPLARRPRQALMQAHRMMQTGNYPEAARVYEHLAHSARNLGMVHRSAQLYLQAARANLQARQVELGMSKMYEGLNILAEAQRWPALYQNGQLAVGEIRRMGLQQEADELQNWLNEILKDHPQAAAVSFGPLAENSSARLPAKCPFCGGTLDPAKVEWLDQATAECSYCGSAIPTE